jgi:hypothetical protein
MRTSLSHFERIVRPHRMSAISTGTIDGFIAVRQTERGHKPKS